MKVAWRVLALGLLLVLALPSFAGAAARPLNIDAIMKLELLQGSQRAPQIVWLGSSTSREVDPRQIKQLTGKRAFNGSISAGRPSQHNHVGRVIERRFPDKHPHLVLGLDVEQLRGERDRLIRPRPAGASPSAYTRFRSDGFRLTDIYTGRPSTLNQNIERYKTHVYPKFKRLQPTQLRHLDEFLVIANRNGVAPTIVLYPVHAKFASVMRPLGRDKRLRDLRLWLKAAEAKGRKFEVVDMTSPKRFGGTKEGFFDGVHQRSNNTRLMVKAVVRSGALSRGVIPAE